MFPAVSAVANTNSLFNLSLSSSFPHNHAQSCQRKPFLLRSRLARKQICGVSVSRGNGNKVELPAGLEAELMPKHVAVIMDGNRRWAVERGFPPQDGHRVGAEAMKEFVINCCKYGVKVVTLFAVSTENFVLRPEVEAKAMLKLLADFIILYTDKLLKNDIRLSFIGKRGSIPNSLQKLMADAEERTKENKRIHILFTFNYGGRSEVIEATKQIASKVKNGGLQVEDIDEVLIEQHLETNVIGDEFCNPDLLIRSSGELRTSNCMLWQLAYTEMFFTKKPFPEFNEADLIEAITSFQQSKRRYLV